ncbi:HPr family phosphocarrier protein [Lentisphaerota bacterium WC36G]|nr:HPr family phosphocarrier protein [Lentisphaerae bacterium WC36]
MLNESGEVCNEFEIQNVLGLHARAATLFVQTASEYDSEITVEKDGERVNGKSLMSLLMLCAGFGTSIKVTATGSDCEEALVAIGELINNKFGED